MHKVEVQDHDKFLFDEPGLIGSGGNSGFQAINIAAQFGATRILLIGFDMHTGSGVHWYGLNAWRDANNPSINNMLRWRDALTKQAHRLSAMGIEVINASADSALRCFQIKTIDVALEAWGLGNIEAAQVDMDRVRSPARRGGGVRGREKLDPAASDAADSDHGIGAG